MWMGPGPVWATGGAMVTVTEGSAASGSSRGSGGTVSARHTPTWVAVMLATDCGEGGGTSGGSGPLAGSPRSRDPHRRWPFPSAPIAGPPCPPAD